MKASYEDRTYNPTQKKSGLLWLVILLILIGGGIGAYFYLQEDSPNSPTLPKKAGTELSRVNEPLPEVPVIEVREPNFILPSLNESDGEIRTRLIDLSEELAPWLQSEELIRRGVSFNDGLSKGVILSKLVSLPTPEGRFQIKTESDGIYLSEANYQRYDYLENIIGSIDPEKSAKLFHLFRPLLEKAYGELGYQPSTMGASLIFTLDQILETPVLDDPVKLKLDSVYYTFEDPKLEALSPFQKQLIRTGPETTRLIQEKARILKSQLLPEEKISEPAENLQ